MGTRTVYDGLGLPVEVPNRRPSPYFGKGGFKPGHGYTPKELHDNSVQTKQNIRAGITTFYAGRPMKRDLDRIAAAEGRSRSAVICGLLRLGMQAYFELAGRSQEADALLRKMESFETTGE
jgi:hypothetical protein